MSNARNLADLLGTNTTIQTAKLADDAVTGAKLPTGSVIQVATDVSTTYTEVTGTTYTAGDTSVTFTPLSASSTILLMWSGCVAQKTNGQQGHGLAFFEGSTQLNDQPHDAGGPYTNYKDETRIFTYMTMTHTVSAGSTSARTYTIKGRKYASGSASLFIGVDGSTSNSTQSLTVMEIAG